MKYYLVVQAPAYPMGPERFSVESAFAVHLRELRAMLGPAYTELVLVGPGMSEARWQALSAGMSTLEFATSGVRFVPAFPLETSRASFLLRRLVPLLG